MSQFQIHDEELRVSRCNIYSMSLPVTMIFKNEGFFKYDSIQVKIDLRIPGKYAGDPSCAFQEAYIQTP